MFETLEAETQLGNLTKSYEKLPIWAIWATGFQLKGALSSTCKTPSQTQNLEQLVTTLWRPVVPLRCVPSTREDRSIYADVYPCLSMFMHFAVKAAALSVCAKLQEDTNEHSRRRQKYSHSKGACGRAIPVISILDNTMFENKMKKLTMGDFGIAQAYTFHACKSEQCRHHPWQSSNSTLQRRALPTFERRLNIGKPQNLHCYHLLSFERLATQMQNKVTQTLSAYLILDRLFASVYYIFLCKWVETCTGYWIEMY